MFDAFINIRGNTGDDRFLDAVRNTIGQTLPTEPNTTTRGDHCVFWLGPDEWMVATSGGNRAGLVEKLEGALSEVHAAVNDLSGGNIAFTLTGPDVLDVLTQGCTLDFAAFTEGDCAQTGVGKAGVLISREAENDFVVVVRRSFADYLEQWLRHAGRSREFEFS